jgi:hypothetical protein
MLRQGLQPAALQISMGTSGKRPLQYALLNNRSGLCCAASGAPNFCHCGRWDAEVPGCNGSALPSARFEAMHLASDRNTHA